MKTKIEFVCFLCCTLTFTQRKDEPRNRFFLAIISNIWKSWKSSRSPIENGKKFELFLPNVRAQGIHEDLWRAILSQGKFNPVEIFSVKKRAKWAKVPALTFLGKVYRTVVLSSNQNNRRKLYVKCGFPCKNKKHAIFARFQKDPQNKTKIDGQVISRILAYWLHNAVPTGAGEGGGVPNCRGCLGKGVLPKRSKPALFKTKIAHFHTCFQTRPLKSIPLFQSWPLNVIIT